MVFMHANKVNNTFECNLLHDIINTPKHTKKSNIHYSHVLHRCMNTRKGKSRSKTFETYWTVYAVPRF